MSPGTRCDEILRLIDEVLGDAATTDAPAILGATSVEGVEAAEAAQHETVAVGAGSQAVAAAAKV